MLVLLIFLLAATGAAQVPGGSRGEFQAKESPLKITIKPPASARGCGNGSGRAVIKVTFDKSGAVTDATAVSASPCQIFNQSAVRAARNIKFQPAARNGKPVTVVRSVEYTYSVY